MKKDNLLSVVMAAFIIVVLGAFAMYAASVGHTVVKPNRTVQIATDVFDETTLTTTEAKLLEINAPAAKWTLIIENTGSVELANPHVYFNPESGMAPSSVFWANNSGAVGVWSQADTGYLLQGPLRICTGTLKPYTTSVTNNYCVFMNHTGLPVGYISIYGNAASTVSSSEVSIYFMSEIK